MSENFPPNFKPVLLEYKAMFESYTKDHGYIQSEASFANHFIWQHSWDIRMAAHTKAMFILMESDLYRPLLLMPFMKDPSDSILPHMLDSEEYMFGVYGCFYMKGATAEMVEKIKADCGDRYAFAYDSYNSEYVYNSDDLINLRGKKYHSKRNHVNTFLKRYEATVEDYTSANREECLELQRKWAAGRDDMTEREAREEYESIERALDYREELGLRACVVKIGGQVEAFSVGERIREDAAVIHIEKANRDFDGLYAYINREFAAGYWADCKYINREEDLGVPGIRKAKQSYHPAFMIDKYDVFLNEEAN